MQFKTVSTEIKTINFVTDYPGRLLCAPVELTSLGNTVTLIFHCFFTA